MLRILHDAVDRIARMITVDEAVTPADGTACATPCPTTPRPTRGCSPRSPRTRPASRTGRSCCSSRAGLDATRRERAGLAYRRPDELLERPALVQDSLVAAGDARAAYGELQHLVWQVQTFGFHLAELEVRQHSAVHRAALTELLGLLPGSRPTHDPAAAASDAVVLDRLAVEGWPELHRRGERRRRARCSTRCG